MKETPTKRTHIARDSWPGPETMNYMAGLTRKEREGLVTRADAKRVSTSTRTSSESREPNTILRYSKVYAFRVPA